MINIEAISTNIPIKRVSIMQLERETALPKEMLSIYRLIYGLNTIPIWDDNPEILLFDTIKPIIDTIDLSQLRYVIFPHTASFLLPTGSYLTNIKNTFHLKKAILFETSMYKCVSFFKTLEMLGMLLNKNDMALVITGEVAFTPKLRVVPGSSIVGDAATASLFSFHGKDHRLLSVVNAMIRGFEEGIYLTENQLRDFDAFFIQKMVDVIIEAISKAKITLENITLILPHNVNIPTWKKISNALSFSIANIYLENIAKLGHCFCSDHIINLQSALSDNRLKKGDYYVMAGCGLGFYLSAAVFQY